MKLKVYLLSLFLILSSCVGLQSQTLDQAYINTYNPLLNGSTCDETTLAAAAASANSSGKTIYLTAANSVKAPCSWTLNASVSIAATRMLEIPRGVTVNLNGGAVTLTACVQAGEYSIFSGAGSLVIPDGCSQEVKAIWFQQDSAGLSKADSAAVTSTLPLLISNGTWNINTNLTLNSRYAVKQGATFAVANAVTLTSSYAPDAGYYPIYSLTGTGAVTFSKAVSTKAEWWGAIPDDSNTDSAPAIKSALFSYTTGNRVELQGKTYYIGSKILYPIISSGVASLTSELIGNGYTATVLLRKTGYADALIEIGDFSVNLTSGTIKDLTLDGLDRTAGSIGIRMKHAHHLVADRVYFTRLERGVYASGGGQNAFYNSFFVRNVDGFVADNGNNFSSDIWQFYNTRFNNSHRYDIDIDGTSNAELVREFYFYGNNHDGEDTTGPGITGVRIQSAEKVHFYGGHFEDRDPHVSVTGGDASNSTRFITFNNVHFGNLHPDTVDNKAVVWNGNAVDDGMGSYFMGCTLFTGELEFNQNRIIPLYNLELISATFSTTGTNYVLQHPTNVEFVNIQGAPEDGTWRLQRTNKVESAYTSRGYEFESTVTTASAATTTILTFTLPTGTASFLVQIQAQSANNAEQARYSFVGLLKYDGADSSVVGTQQALHTAIESGGATAWNAVIVAGGTGSASALVRVIGDASVTVYWFAKVTMLLTFDN